MPNTTKRTAAKRPTVAKKTTAKKTAPVRTTRQTLTIKRGRLWTYVYNQDGDLLAEIRNDAIRTVTNVAGLAVAS